MSTADSYRPRYTADDYSLWKGDWELWEGYPVAMSPSPFGRHQAVASKVLRRLGNQIELQNCEAIALAEIDWIVSDDTVVRPDVVVLCGGLPERHVTSSPAIAIEILSPSTRQNDRTFKRALYEKHKVANYWIVDPEAGQVDVYQLASDGKYIPEEAVSNISVRICDGCQLELDSTDILAI